VLCQEGYASSLAAVSLQDLSIHRATLFQPLRDKADIGVDMDAFVTSGPVENLCGVSAGTTRICPACPRNCPDPTVKVAQPRRMMNVSAYGCLCSRGPTPALVVDSKMIEILALPGSSS
jgi:hypothetical protein